MNVTNDERRVIYRVQDSDGRGPWKPGCSHRWVEDRPNEEFERLVPGPWQFGSVRPTLFGMAVGYGCTSLEQLRQWFTPGEYSTLRELGYQAVRLAVGRILGESDIQCVFERSKPLAIDAEPVDLYPPNVFTTEHARRRLKLAEIADGLGKACD